MTHEVNSLVVEVNLSADHEMVHAEHEMRLSAYASAWGRNPSIPDARTVWKSAPGVHLFVALRGGSLIGSSRVVDGNLAQTWCTADVCVSKDMEHRGVGTALAGFTESWMSKHRPDLQYVSCQVELPGNPRAFPFARRNGFAESSRDTVMELNIATKRDQLRELVNSLSQRIGPDSSLTVTDGVPSGRTYSQLKMLMRSMHRESAMLRNQDISDIDTDSYYQYLSNGGKYEIITASITIGRGNSLVGYSLLQWEESTRILRQRDVFLDRCVRGRGASAPFQAAVYQELDDRLDVKRVLTCVSESNHPQIRNSMNMGFAPLSSNVRMTRPRHP